MSQYRKNLVQKVYKTIDKKGDGIIPEDEVKQLFVASRHPDVLIRKRNEDDVLTEFLDTFEEFIYFVVFYIGEK